MKILFCKTKYLCYNSNSVFMSAMAKELYKLGVEVEWCEVMEEETAACELEKFIGRTYDAVIDFNSVLPRAVTESGVRFPDLLHAPFYNYIVDHPMFHHPIVNMSLQDYHIICLDRNHKKYIEALYPNVKSVIFLPLAAMPALHEVHFEEKKTPLLFSGTFMPSKEQYDEIQKFHGEERKDMKLLVERMLADTSLTLEQALHDLLKETGRELTGEQFREKMNRYYRTDFFVRTYNRELLVETLLKAGLPLEIIGNGWEEFKSPYASRLKIREGVSYPLSLQMTANAKISLNIMPLFKDGIHDRVLTAMANHTVAVSDTSVYLEEKFQDGRDILLYQLNDMESLAQRLWKLLEDPDDMQKMAEAGYEKAMREHTWRSRMQELVKML